MAKKLSAERRETIRTLLFPKRTRPIRSISYSSPDQPVGVRDFKPAREYLAVAQDLLRALEDAEDENETMRGLIEDIESWGDLTNNDPLTASLWTRIKAVVWPERVVADQQTEKLHLDIAIEEKTRPIRRIFAAVKSGDCSVEDARYLIIAFLPDPKVRFATALDEAVRAMWTGTFPNIELTPPPT